MEFKILIGLFTVMFGGIIGVYIWTFKVYRDVNKQLGSVYALINKHLQNSDIHRGEKHFVPVEVCKALTSATKDQVNDIAEKQTAVMKDLGEVKGDVKMILAKVNGR
jgi:hypothetical protein|tara:strand:+ start:227 stop:547 length:321 start_codon:yes stop_codon:yes gene_type:complete